MNQNTLILISYIAIGDISDQDAATYIAKLKNKIKLELNNDDCVMFFIPIRSGQSRVECINPQYLSKKDYELKTSKIIIELEAQVTEFLAGPKKKTKIIKDK